MNLPDRYEVLRRIANGGMASVWCAHDRLLGRDVAVKLLAEQFAHDPSAIRRFKREARAAARLSSHPHVVTIYDVGESVAAEDEFQQAFIVMEYLAGGTVADALRVGEVTQDLALDWLHEAAAALDYAHSHGVIHRDIKPANFLLDGNRVLHVADFGIARLGTEETITNTGYLLGTAAYLAPERALGRPASEASDRYSLAVAAFELLTGGRPFSGEQVATLARQHVDEKPPRASSRNPSLPRAVDAVLARGMAKIPEERWPTAAALVETLDLALREGATRRMPVMVPAASGLSAAASGLSAAAAGLSAIRPPARELRMSARSRRPRRVPAIAALAAAAFGVGIAAGAGHGPGTPHARIAAGKQRAQSSTTGANHTSRAHRRHPSHSPAVTATRAAATSAPPSADALEAKGHQLMVSGDYAAAIPILRQAVAAAAPGGLTYAYALFDLGRSLRLSGDPKDAIPILYRRLQIPNQTGVVRAELQAALLAVGAQLHGGGPPGHGKHKGHGSAD